MILKNKSALVTGGTRGIGAEIVREFLAQGARVVTCGRSTEALELARRLRADGYEVEALQGDISDDSHVRALIQLCRSKFGGLDVVVNNAGVLLQGKLGMLRLDDARRMLEVNVLATINVSQYAIRAFPRASGGAVINLASIAGTQGIDGLAAYSASKAAVIGFTKAAAKELAPQRIRVNAIAPGFIDTDMARQVSPDWFQRRTDSIRIGRIGQPQDIAKCASFLASDAASYITGQIIGVDGSMPV